MKIRISAWVLCSLAAATCAAAVSAEEGAADAERIRSGPYLGLGIGGAMPLIRGETFFVPLDNTASINDKNSLAINARIGWRLLPFLAAEVQYEWVDEFQMQTRGRSCAKADMQLITGNIKLIAPTGSVQPYLLAGVGASQSNLDIIEVEFAPENSCMIQNGYQSSQTKWEMAARFGGGLDFYLTRSILMNLEASTIYSDDKFLGEQWPYVSVSAGIQYRF